jgi:SpoVK/Ycf46/Vps4 family AAA+-type ATPase
MSRALAKAHWLSRLLIKQGFNSSAIGSAYKDPAEINLFAEFEKAKRLALKHGASVLILDEVNQLGKDRGNTSGGSNVTAAVLQAISKYTEQEKTIGSRSVK